MSPSRVWILNLLALSGSLIVRATAQSTTSVSVPAARPSDAVVVPSDFVGFGFETGFLNSYDNEFSNNLVNSIADRMSVPPIIRVGGTSGDLVKFDAQQKENTTCTGDGCENSSGTSFTLGPSYFEGFKSFPRAHMSFQAPLGATPTNVSLIYVERAYKALGAGRTAAIAIGNEPAFDVTTKAQVYVDDAKSLENKIIDALGLTGAAKRIFEVGEINNHYTETDVAFTLEDAFKAGLNDTGNVKLAAKHYYQVVERAKTAKEPGTDLSGQILNHTYIKSHFIPYQNSLTYLDGRTPYVLSETGSALVGNLSFTGAFAACLWSVDFQLYAMSRGVARVDGTQRPAAQHSLWVPVSGLKSNPGPSVRPPFYAQPFIADFIGKSGTTAVVNLGLGSEKLAAYAAYNGATLARVAIVNLNEWNSGDGKRPVQSFVLNLPKGINSVTVRHLHSDAGAGAFGYDFGGPDQNLTWAGTQWSFKIDNGNGHVSDKVSTTVNAVGGSVTIPVPDSEAVIVSF